MKNKPRFYVIQHFRTRLYNKSINKNMVENTIHFFTKKICELTTSIFIFADARDCDDVNTDKASKLRR